MGSDYSSTNESMAEILGAMRQYFPGTMESVRSTYQPQAQSEFDITKEFTPQYAQLQYDTLAGPGRKLSELGRELSKEEQLGSAETELAIAQGPGKKLAQEASNLQAVMDPEAYKTKADLSTHLSDAFKDLGLPSELSKGETEGIARGLGRNQYSVGSPMEDIKGAMVFGDRMDKRRDQFNTLLQTATAAIPSMRSGLTGFEAATKRTLLPNFGQQNYTGIQTPGVNTSNQFGQNYMNNATSIENTTKQKQKDGWDQFEQFSKGFSNLASSGGTGSLLSMI